MVHRLDEANTALQVQREADNTLCVQLDFVERLIVALHGVN